MAHDYSPEIQAALDAIREFGAPAVVIRGGAVEFPCKALQASYTAIERQNSLINYTDRKLLVAAADLASDLSFEFAESDQIKVTNPKTGVAKTYRIVTPPVPLAPGGVNILFEIQARL